MIWLLSLISLSSFPALAIINGNWTEWGQWSDCSKCCGTGNQTRLRDCTNPPPSNGGVDCVGEPTEIRECNTHPCTGIDIYKNDLTIKGKRVTLCV